MDQQIIKALKLYKAYKTLTREYSEIASSLGMTTAELNHRCCHIKHDKK